MKKVKNTLLFIQFTNLFASNLLGPIYAAYVKGIGGDLLTAGTALALDFAVIGLLIIISGRIANKFHTEKIQLILGYVLAIFVAYGFMIIKTPLQLFIVETFAGLSIAISQPAFSGIFSERMESGSHAASWGDYLGLTYFAAAISSFASGLISQNFGFAAIFISMMILNVISTLGAVYFYYLEAN